MTPNEKTIKDFADQFEPPLAYAQTARINNIAFPDAWQCTYWNDTLKVGITAVAYEGQIHAFIEAAGRGKIAAEAGRIMATAFNLLKPQVPHGPA